ncbi:hypothetical protein LTR56_021775 [Elasticomyces elasticus]|nr:hypothetical protein LTR56_021775 [Elasticomyces elasticus]KAK3630531.1 hypothetical protein LTR22_021447 [Elasticomyces elasticus]
MSAFRMTFARRAAPISRSTGTTRSFQSCRVLAAGKESTLSRLPPYHDWDFENQEGRSEEVEAHKQDQLQKQKEGKGHWKDELASDSESIVKADRNETGSTKDNIAELQKESTKLANEGKA